MVRSALETHSPVATRRIASCSSLADRRLADLVGGFLSSKPDQVGFPGDGLVSGGWELGERDDVAGSHAADVALAHRALRPPGRSTPSSTAIALGLRWLSTDSAYGGGMVEQQEPFLSEDDIQAIAREIADGAGISTAQARKVLELLHIDWVNGNIEALRTIAQDSTAQRVTGLSQEAARELAELSSSTRVSLDTLRIAVKPPRQAGLVV